MENGKRTAKSGFEINAFMLKGTVEGTNLTMGSVWRGKPDSVLEPSRR